MGERKERHRSEIQPTDQYPEENNFYLPRKNLPDKRARHWLLILGACFLLALSAWGIYYFAS